MNNKYFEIYSRRINRLNFLIIFISIFILFNFFKLQFFHHPDLSKQLKKDSIKTKTVIGNRGKILDRNNKELAITINKYDFWVNANKKNDSDKIANLFSEVFNKNKMTYLEIINQNSNYAVLEKNIANEQAYLILNQIKNIKGLNYVKKPSRFYQYNEFASQTIGYINSEGAGKIGIEKKLNSLLDGDTITINLKKGAKGKFFNHQISDLNNIQGFNIKLTIDIELQKILQEELKKAVFETNSIGANGIIVNPNNGEILAIASIPDFNPNKYNEFPYENFNNAVVSNTYEPGSTFKIIPIALTLNNQKYSINDSIDCEKGFYRLSNNKLMHDHEENGILSIKDILVHSSNIGISKLSNSYDKESFYKLIKKFGFGTQTNIPLNNEAKGKIRTINQWSKTSKNYLSIGQELSITNLQLAMSYCAIANGGNLIKPSIVKKIYKKDSVVYQNENKTVRKVLNDTIANQILYILKEVVNYGTAQSINLENYNIAGKTGTAQKFKNGHLDNYIATFASIFPSDMPEYVMVVSIDEPEYGKHWSNLSAVPASREIIKRILVQNSVVHEKLAKQNEIRTEIGNKLSTLSNSSKRSKNHFPNFKGKTLKEALKIAKELDITLEPEGISGRVIKQSIKPGVKIKKNSICKIKIKI